VTPDRSFYAPNDNAPASANRRSVREGVGKSAIRFVLAVAFTAGGLWLLYRNLVYGDVVSGPIVAVSAMMIGSGTLMLPPAILGRRDW